ncbi:protein of unknown function [Paramicrobacterium humi]|uniref:DUF4190 domain-containing protein n=1 Tax=Paramicrobacterium humi TaxID=640635 RepID=A0A1H4JWX6_9MICO|nr:DUF4190 domain-containing protein [Microbacterium humi]SEB50335.1 protein of unknown function [Microbacterium humi]
MSNTPPPAAPAPGQYPGNQQPYQQQPYQQQPYGYAPAPQDKWNVLAIVSFVGSLIGFSIIAAILGFVSLSQIKKTGEKGRGLAIAAVIIGIVSVVIQIIVVIAVIAAIGAASTYDYNY